jgi:hypothetical protein
MKLTKDQVSRRAVILANVHSAHASLCDFLGRTNETIRALQRALEANRDLYNEALEAAETDLQELGSELESAIENRSDKWRESPAGEATQTWVESYQNVSFERFEPTDLEEFEEPDAPDEFAADECLTHDGGHAEDSRAWP